MLTSISAHSQLQITDCHIPEMPIPRSGSLNPLPTMSFTTIIFITTRYLTLSVALLLISRRPPDKLYRGVAVSVGGLGAVEESNWVIML